MHTAEQGFGAILFWDGSSSGNFLPGAAPGIFYPKPAPAPDKREQNLGFFFNWLQIV